MVGARPSLDALDDDATPADDVPLVLGDAVRGDAVPGDRVVLGDVVDPGEVGRVD